MMLRKLFLVAAAMMIFAGAISAQDTSSADKTDATATEKPKRGPIFRPTKDQIREVQEILIKKKLYDGEADGKYNDETRAGIKLFQKDNGLKQTGTLNRATLEKFGVELTESQEAIPVSPGSFADGDSGKSETKTAKSVTKTASPDSTDKPKRPAPFRANKEQIMTAQRLLKSKGMYDGEETGKFNDDFRAGIKEFQKANDVKVTGTLNAVTLEAMGIALTDAQKANVAAAAAYSAASKDDN